MNPDGITPEERSTVAANAAQALAELDAGAWSLLPPDEVHAILRDCTARVMPPAWTPCSRGDDGWSWRHAMTHQLVFVSVSRERDGKRWLHLSTSFPHRLPTFEELRVAKNLFLGREREAVQKFPRESQYVSHAVKAQPYVLHLWACLDGDVTPDFRKGGTL